MKAEDIKINPAVFSMDFSAFSAPNARLQIPDFLTDESAEALFQMISQNKQWYLAYNEGNQFFESPKADFDTAPPQVRQGFIQNLYKRAGQGFQYFFQQYYISQALRLGEDTGHPMHIMEDFFHGDEFKALIEKITGECPGWADVFASCYAPGHFLTDHSDVHPTHDRIVAFTLSMTKNWHHNWGGHTVFFDDEGNIEAGFKPKFNSFTVFRNPQAHAVQMVAPYAPALRYSYLGWANRGKRIEN